MMAVSSGSSTDSLCINEIAPAGVIANKFGRLIVAMEKKKGDDVVDGLTHPSKGRKVKRVGIEDLKSCDQIYVGAYIFKDLGKAEKKEKKGHRRTAGHLWQHHLLIGRVQNFDNELVLTRSFYVYEFTGEYTYASGITSGLTRAMKNADTRKYLVTATKSREGASKWSINNKDFRNYTKRGLNRYEHDEYGDDEAYIDLVIRRAEATCKASLKGEYDMLHYNCEHIVTACKGLCNGYGYCFQFKTFGKDQIPQPLPPHSVPAEGYDSAETVTLAGDIQATDDADDDKDEDSKLMIDYEFEDDCYPE